MPTNPGLSRSSSSDSLDSLASPTSESAEPRTFGRMKNTVKAIQPDGKVDTFQLPSLITPVSLFGKRIR